MTKTKKVKIKNFLSNKKHRLWLVLFLILVTALIVFWRRGQNKQGEFTEYQVVRQDISQTLVLSGTLDAKERVYLNFLAGGSWCIWVLKRVIG